MESLTSATLATIVRKYHATASVFEKHNLDYCCKGKRPLGEACIEAGIDTDTLVKELEAAMTHPGAPSQNLTDALQLIGHIMLKHHFFVRQSAPAIRYHLAKVVSKHGERYPWMEEVYHLFADTEAELMQHMQKEETILFPRIQQVYHAPDKSSFPPVFLEGPILEMESEHTAAGDNLYAIRKLLKQYTAPDDACTTHRLVIDELKAFEEDLHQHVHLENNVLFPMAQKMLESKLVTAF